MYKAKRGPLFRDGSEITAEGGLMKIRGPENFLIVSGEAEKIICLKGGPETFFFFF